MSRVYDPEAFKARVDLAAQYIAGGRNPTRTFDTCFEMHDGDAVSVALYRRAQRNPRLKRNLWRYLSRRVCLPVIWQERRRPTRDLPQWAAELRRKAKEDFEEFMRRVEQERAEREATAARLGAAEQAAR